MPLKQIREKYYRYNTRPREREIAREIEKELYKMHIAKTYKNEHHQHTERNVNKTKGYI